MPSIHKTSIIISILLLSLLVDKHLANTCCSGDKICSGCWMCEGSVLRKCWDRATPMPSKCAAKKDMQQKAACYCKAYAAIAKCWGAGTCCTEYAPTLAAATDLCNLQTYPSHMISQWQLTEAVKGAAKVADGIWHNDSGVDVPKYQSHIKPYTGGAVATGTVKAKPHTYRSYKDDQSAAPPKSSEKHHVPPTRKHQDNSSSTTKPKDDHSKHVTSEPSSQHYDSNAHKYDKKHKHKKGSEHKQNHKKEGDCDKKHKHSKRASHTSLDISAEELNEARLSKRKIICGIDFQNVAYPVSVPKTVQKAYDEI